MIIHVNVKLADMNSVWRVEWLFTLLCSSQPSLSGAFFCLSLSVVFGQTCWKSDHANKRQISMHRWLTKIPRSLVDGAEYNSKTNHGRYMCSRDRLL